MTDASQARVDHSTAWVAVASTVLGVLDLLSTLICLWLWVSTSEFGAATLAIALFPILDRLGGLGLVGAVVRETESGHDGLSSIFWVGLAASTVLTAILVLAQPLIGMAFAQPIVATLLAAYGGRIMIRQLCVVPEALMKHGLRYRELSIVRIVAMFAEVAAKLGFAYLGAHTWHDFTIWCFALGPIANVIVTTIGCQLYCRWWPRFTFQREVAMRAVRFTASISGGELLYFAYTSADYLVIGTYFGDAAVGVYRLAYELVLDVVRLFSLVTTEVAFPMFVRLSNDRGAVGAHLLRFTRQNLIALAPFLIFVGVEADDLLALLYPPLPESAATVARILCVVGALRTLGFILPALLAGVGQASRVFAYNLLAAIVLPLAFVAAANLFPEQGYVAVAWAWAAGYPVAFGVLLVMTLGAAELGVAAYGKAIAGVLVCAVCAMAAGVLVRVVLPELALVRTLAVAPVVLGVYALLLARIEHVTLPAIIRSIRSAA